MMDSGVEGQRPRLFRGEAVRGLEKVGWSECFVFCHRSGARGKRVVAVKGKIRIREMDGRVKRC